MSEIKKIISKQEIMDKNGNKFLIIRTNPDKIFVFSSVVPENEWTQLEIGKSYSFKLGESREGNKKLISFTKVIQAYWCPITKKAIIK